MNTIRARINLKVGQHSDIDAEIVTFTLFDENNEHIALIFQQADKNQQVPLVRMHSECLTGDVFHSSRCDCGEQLDETINLMKDKGGAILYLHNIVFVNHDFTLLLLYYSITLFSLFSLFNLNSG